MKAKGQQKAFLILTCRLLLQTTDRRSSCLPRQSSHALLGSHPWDSACLGWTTLGSSPADGSHTSPGLASSSAKRSTWALKYRVNKDTKRTERSDKTSPANKVRPAPTLWVALMSYVYDCSTLNNWMDESCVISNNLFSQEFKLCKTYV